MLLIALMSINRRYLEAPRSARDARRGAFSPWTRRSPGTNSARASPALVLEEGRHRKKPLRTLPLCCRQEAWKPFKKLWQGRLRQAIIARDTLA